MGQTIEISWLKVTYQIGFGEFTTFMSDMEEAIQARKNGLEQDFEEQSRGLDDESKDGLFQAMYLDDYSTIKESFPNILIRSMIFSCYSFFEAQLKNVCDVLHRSYRFPPLKKQNFGIIQSKQYLSKDDALASLFDGRSWEQIDEIRRIRNFIVHEGKSVVRAGDEVYAIMQTMSHMINVAPFAASKSSKAQIYTVAFQYEFVRYMIATFTTFLHQLCTALDALELKKDIE